MQDATKPPPASDGVPKWLQPITLTTVRLPVRIDPRLQVDEDTAYLLQLDAQPLTGMVTVFMTSNYDTVLAAEIIDDGEHELHTLVRAATGDEAAYLLDTDDEEEDEGSTTAPTTNAGLASAGRSVTWHEGQNDEPIDEKAVVLWAGEVLLNSGKGHAGPFYGHETRAKAWAFSAALSLPEDEVFGAQVVGYHCARGQAAGLLAGGGVEFRRLNRFWSPPMRTSSVLPIALPGRRLDEDGEAV